MKSPGNGGKIASATHINGYSGFYIMTSRAPIGHTRVSAIPFVQANASCVMFPKAFSLSKRIQKYRVFII